MCQANCAHTTAERRAGKPKAQLFRSVLERLEGMEKGESFYVAHGHIQEDEANRFRKGELIRTSRILSMYMDKEGAMYIETLNTIYEVV